MSTHRWHLFVRYQKPGLLQGMHLSNLQLCVYHLICYNQCFFFLDFLSSCNPCYSTFSCFEKLVPNSLSFESAVNAFVPCAVCTSSEELVCETGFNQLTRSRSLTCSRPFFQTNFLHLQGIAGHNRAPLQAEQCWHLGCSALDWTGIHGPATQPCSGHRALPRSTQIGNVIQLTGPHILA